MLGRLICITVVGKPLFAGVSKQNVHSWQIICKAYCIKHLTCKKYLTSKKGKRTDYNVAFTENPIFQVKNFHVNIYIKYNALPVPASYYPTQLCSRALSKSCKTARLFLPATEKDHNNLHLCPHFCSTANQMTQPTLLLQRPMLKETQVIVKVLQVVLVTETLSAVFERSRQWILKQ